MADDADIFWGRCAVKTAEEIKASPFVYDHEMAQPHWREDNTCSHCGGMRPSIALKAIREGAEVVPTDKNYKCQPLGTKVSVVISKGWSSRPSSTEEKNIEQLQEGDSVLTYAPSQCHFMHNGRSILKIGKRYYTGPLIVATSNTSQSAYTPEHLCVVKTGNAFDGFHVYLMRRGTSFRIGRCTGWNKSQSVQGRAGILIRAFTEKADAIWVLASFDTLSAAAETEYYLQWRYNIPGLTFRASNGSVVMRQKEIDDFPFRILQELNLMIFVSLM